MSAQVHFYTVKKRNLNFPLKSTSITFVHSNFEVSSQRRIDRHQTCASKYYTRKSPHYALISNFFSISDQTSRNSG